MALSVCVAGATGWVGRPIAAGVLAADDLTLAAAVARSVAGQDLGQAWGGAPMGVRVSQSVAEALTERPDIDVLVEVTSPEAALANTLTAVGRGVHVVIGSSGLTAAELDQIDAAARQADVGVVAAGNFSITAAMAAAAALLVAPHLPHREIIDYASAAKPDVPSGTARELAERLGQLSRPELARSLDQISGPIQARGADVDGTQVHSVRLPSFVVSTEVVFGLPDERLTIRHDAGGSADPYVTGALLAVRAARTRAGLVRGMDRLILGSDA